ncbi:unnamed protein product [Calypogeia fissa]
METVVQEPEQEVIEEPKFPPYFFEDYLERDLPAIFCSALQYIIDEGLPMLWGLSFLTDDVLSLLDKKVQTPEKTRAAQLLKHEICSEVFQGLCKHKEILMSWEMALKTEEAEEIMEVETKLSQTAWLLCKLFSIHSESADVLKEVGGRQFGAIRYFMKAYQKFRLLMLRRLGTSVKQEESIADYQKEMFRREAKAMKDHHALEQQLEIERLERAEHYAQYQEVEKKIQYDKDQSNAQTLALERQLEADCKLLAEQEFGTFNTEEKMLSGQNNVMSSQLVKMQNDNQDRELSLRGKKSQSVEEVEALLDEYEQAILTRKAELDLLCKEHREMVSKIDQYQGFFDEEARVAFEKEEVKRIAWEKICERFLSRKRYYHAARKIQRAWRKHLTYEAKKKKNEGKGKKKGKKGKAKKSKDIMDLMPKRSVPKKKGKTT